MSKHASRSEQTFEHRPAVVPRRRVAECRMNQTWPPPFESGPKRGEGFHLIVSHRISDLYRFNLLSFPIISSYRKVQYKPSVFHQA